MYMNDLIVVQWGLGLYILASKLDLVFSSLLKGIPEDNLEILYFLHVLKRPSPYLTVPWPYYMKNGAITLVIHQYHLPHFPYY